MPIHGEIMEWSFEYSILSDYDSPIIIKGTVQGIPFSLVVERVIHGYIHQAADGLLTMKNKPKARNIRMDQDMVGATEYATAFGYLSGEYISDMDGIVAAPLKRLYNKIYNFMTI